MCGHCYDDECGCYGRRYYPRSFESRPRYYDEPVPEERRGYLEEEKRILERRLKEIEIKIEETSK